MASVLIVDDAAFMRMMKVGSTMTPLQKIWRFQTWMWPLDMEWSNLMRVRMAGIWSK